MRVETSFSLILERTLSKMFLLKPKNFMTPFYGWGSTALRLQSHYKEAVYFLPLTIIMTKHVSAWTSSTNLTKSGFRHLLSLLPMALIHFDFAYQVRLKQNEATEKKTLYSKHINYYICSIHLFKEKLSIYYSKLSRSCSSNVLLLQINNTTSHVLMFMNIYYIKKISKHCPLDEDHH